MTNEKVLLRYCSKYVSEFQGEFTRGIPERSFQKIPEHKVHTCISKNVSQRLFWINSEKLPLELSYVMRN